jgi:hypothetical protein
MSNRNTEMHRLGAAILRQAQGVLDKRLLIDAPVYVLFISESPYAIAIGLLSLANCFPPTAPGRGKARDDCVC